MAFTYLTTTPANAAIHPETVGSLPTCSASVSPDTTAAEVVRLFESNPDDPGVLVLRGRKLLGMISRQGCFEQLGRPFGVEIFLRRPVHVLLNQIDSRQEPLSTRTPIDQAVRYALFRPAKEMYEPLILIDDNGDYHLLDLHILLLAQSRLLTNANTIIQRQMKVERGLSSSIEWHEVIEQIFFLAAELLPFDHAAIFLEEQRGLKLVAARNYTHVAIGAYADSNSHEYDAYQEISLTGGPLATIFENSSKNSSLPSSIYAWLGVPLIHKESRFGLLALARTSGVTFNREEISLVTHFCAQAANAIKNASLYHDLKQHPPYKAAEPSNPI